MVSSLFTRLVTLALCLYFGSAWSTLRLLQSATPVEVGAFPGHVREQTPPEKLVPTARGRDAAAGTVLSVRDTRFTLNGQPTFLLGISDYAALGAPEDFVRRDLDDLASHGFNWVRVWATWGAFDRDVSAVDVGGRTVPMLYQEPFRRGYGRWQPSASDFLADL